MNKESAAWLVLRVIGLVLLLFAFIQLYEFVLNVLAVWINYETSAPVDGTLRLVILSWAPAVNAIALLSGAFYFLRYGTLVYGLIMKEGGK